MPSAEVLAVKHEQVQHLTELIKNASAGVLVGFKGIKVEDDTALRKELREAGVSYKVYKNKLTERACNDAGYTEFKPFLTGMNAFAVSPEDPVAAAKIIKKYADKLDCLEIKAGFVDGAVVDTDKVNKLAETPSKEILIGKMMGSMQSSLYAFARVLQAIIDKKNEGEGAGAAAEPAAE